MAQMSGRGDVREGSPSAKRITCTRSWMQERYWQVVRNTKNFSDNGVQ